MERLRRLPGARPPARSSRCSRCTSSTPRADEVVGSWMTQLGREHAIADNVALRRPPWSRTCRRAPARAAAAPSTSGFSQGARWPTARPRTPGHPGAGVLVLGGDMPPDVADDPTAALPPVLAARGVARRVVHGRQARSATSTALRERGVQRARASSSRAGTSGPIRSSRRRPSTWPRWRPHDEALAHASGRPASTSPASRCRTSRCSVILKRNAQAQPRRNARSSSTGARSASPSWTTRPTASPAGCARAAWRRATGWRSTSRTRRSSRSRTWAR